MPPRKILCLGSPEAIEPLRQPLAAAHWELHGTADLGRAKGLCGLHPFQVGLLLCRGLAEWPWRELDAFLARHGVLEWVGCFDAACLREGAVQDLVLAHLFDHHTYPLNVPLLLACLGHAQGRVLLREAFSGARAAEAADSGPILGSSEAIVQLRTQVRRVAAADAPVLIHGESGSGKELVALSVHRHSPRARGPFVPINCGAIPPTLVQSELFGHEKGAFTGAYAEKRGLFEAAHHGTVFLDEIADLPLALQANLLRFLEEGTIYRVGATHSLQLDVRVVAASHIDLHEAAAEGSFRYDLLYRLDVLPLRVPPLRAHRSDIGFLAHAFFRKFAADRNPRLKGFARDALTAMEAHDWPGNVRELCNRVRSAMIMAEGRLITAQDLGLHTGPTVSTMNALDDARDRAERIVIASSLERTGRNVAGAARQLGVSRMTLYRLLLKHSIDVPR